MSDTAGVAGVQSEDRMTIQGMTTGRATLGLLLLSPVLAFANGLETAAVHAGQRLSWAFPGGGRGQFAFQDGPGLLPVQGGNVGNPSPYFLIKAAAAGTIAAGAAQEVAALELSAIQDGHWKTGNAALNPTLGGKKVFVSGTFDRQQNAYLSVLEDGSATPAFFDLKALLDKPAKLKIGNAVYSIYLAANPVTPLKSQIVFENTANEDDSFSVRVGKLLEGVEGAGSLIQFSDQKYRLFYYRDVKKSGDGVVLDESSKTFALIYKEGEEMHVFLIPSEDVPSDKIAVFKMHDSKRAGLMQKDGKIKIYENP